jgi:hypothetical protein
MAEIVYNIYKQAYFTKRAANKAAGVMNGRLK